MDRKTSTEKIDLKNFDPNTNRRGHRMLKKIISGGQTGADQAALDVAINLGIPHGGWIPKGRKTEKGTLLNTYCRKCRMITMQKELKKT
jgi:ribosomal protein L33